MPNADESIRIGDHERRYRLHLPARSGPDPHPLVIVLHGRNSNAAAIQAVSHFDDVADRNGFAVVYPDGYGKSWNDGRRGTAAAEAGVDDVGFVRILIDRLIEDGTADPNRIGSAGMSNGAVMCHRLGIELGERITAIGCVAGSMPVALSALNPPYAVSALIIHGTADRVSPISGGPGYFGGGDLMPAAMAAKRWGAIDGCSTQVDLPPLDTGADRTSVGRTSYRGGQGGTAVDWWRIERGGHTWPGGSGRQRHAPTSAQFDAAETIWQFFTRHTFPASTRRLITAREEVRRG